MVTSEPTKRTHLGLDAVALARVARLVPVIAAGYTRPRGGAEAEAVDEDYVLTAAVRIGLNRWTLPKSHKPRAEDFFWRSSTNIVAQATYIASIDISRADELSGQLGVPIEPILSAAACTGLAMLSGDAEHAGPFEI